MRLATRRCLWLLIGLTVAALLGLVLALSLLRAMPGRVNRANLARIRPGMTKEQVDALLGSQHFLRWDLHVGLVFYPGMLKGHNRVARYAECDANGNEVFLVRVQFYNGRVVTADALPDDYYDGPYQILAPVRHRYFWLYFNRLRRRLDL